MKTEAESVPEFTFSSVCLPNILKVAQRYRLLKEQGPGKESIGMQIEIANRETKDCFSSASIKSLFEVGEFQEAEEEAKERVEAKDMEFKGRSSVILDT